MRMWVDADNDLYAVPVVVVDPTGSKAVIPPAAPNTWEWISNDVTDAPDTVRTPAFEDDCYLDQYEVCWMGDTLAAAAQNFIILNDGITGTMHDIGWWCAANPEYKSPYNMTLKVPLRFETFMRVQLLTPLATGHVQIHIWGHDEVRP